MHFTTAQARVPYVSLISERSEEHHHRRKLSDLNASQGLSPQSRRSGNQSTLASTHLFRAEASYLAKKVLPDEEDHIELCYEEFKAKPKSKLLGGAETVAMTKSKTVLEQEASSSESSIEEKEMDLLKEMNQRIQDRTVLDPKHSTQQLVNRRHKKQRIIQQSLAPHLSSLEFIHQKLRSLQNE